MLLANFPEPTEWNRYRSDIQNFHGKREALKYINLYTNSRSVTLVTTDQVIFKPVIKKKGKNSYTSYTEKDELWTRLSKGERLSFVLSNGKPKLLRITKHSKNKDANKWHVRDVSGSLELFVSVISKYGNYFPKEPNVVSDAFRDAVKNLLGVNKEISLRDLLFEQLYPSLKGLRSSFTDVPGYVLADLKKASFQELLVSLGLDPEKPPLDFDNIQIDNLTLNKLAVAKALKGLIVSEGGADHVFEYKSDRPITYRNGRILRRLFKLFTVAERVQMLNALERESHYLDNICSFVYRMPLFRSLLTHLVVSVKRPVHNWRQLEESVLSQWRNLQAYVRNELFKTYNKRTAMKELLDDMPYIRGNADLDLSALDAQRRSRITAWRLSLSL